MGGLVTPSKARERRLELERRVSELEADVEELRRHNLRLAELADLVQELLVPMASRDQARIDAALTRYTDGL